MFRDEERLDKPGLQLASDVPLARLGAPFPHAVWDALLAIPPGATCNYARLPRAIGGPQAVRAAAQANGANQLAIVVPCHCVIGADGGLGGYGGGVARKRWLLEHERPLAPAATARVRELEAVDA